MLRTPRVKLLAIQTKGGELVYRDPHLAGLSLTVVPVLFIALVVYGRRSRAALQEVRVRLAELTSTAEEAFSNIGFVKSFMRHDYQWAWLEAKGEAHWHVRLRAALVKAQVTTGKRHLPVSTAPVNSPSAHLET